MIALLKHSKKYRKEIILGPIFKFLEAVFELFLPLYMARLIDKGIAHNDSATIIKTALTMILMSVIGLICVLICQYFAAIASQGFGTELRKQLLKKINTLSHQELDDLGSATLITRMTSDINQLQLALAMLIRLVIRAPFLSIGSVVMAFYINKQMALIFLISLPIFCLILYWMMKKTVPLYRKVQDKLDQLNQVIQENLSGVRVVRAFARKERDNTQMTTTTDELARAYTRVANISALLNPATLLIMNGSIILLLYVGGINVNTGTMGQGEVLALINYLIQMLLALIVVSNLVVIFTRASASASRVNEVFNTEPSVAEITTNSPQPALPDIAGKIRFEDVAFRYGKAGGLALEGINFTLTQGEILGIVGQTGSGKSTLTQLIPRFYDITSGRLTIAERLVSDYPLTNLRELIGIVPQTSVLFSGSIRQNLQWGKPEATDQECWQALTTAQCLDFVQQLPEQLDTLVLEGGKNFSGGQKQRLAIARALIKQPAILILDDSLSALDYQTDLNLRQALKKDLETSTLIIVSQRISSVQQADQIIVLEEGQQVGLGSHQELLKTSLIYQNIYGSQQEQEDALNDN